MTPRSGIQRWVLIVLQNSFKSEEKILLTSIIFHNVLPTVSLIAKICHSVLRAKAFQRENICKNRTKNEPKTTKNELKTNQKRIKNELKTN